MYDPSSSCDTDLMTDQVVGIYSQPYNEIVRPDQVWPVSKYFLRRWLPYLTPTRFWAVIAARQLAYRIGNKRRFACYDGLLYKEAHMSRANFYRIKAEIDQADTAVSLFISREATNYRRQGDVTKPGPTIYYVRLDDILTPGDAHHLTAWLQMQAVGQRTEAVLDLLETARTYSPADLLAPSLTPYLADPPATFQAITVADIVARVFGPTIAHNTAVRKAADALHTHLTASVYLGSQYFRHQWLSQLGAGPAVLISYLRSYCYHNEETGELRDQVTITRPQLADALGVDRTTLFRWFKKIDKKTPMAQPFYPFLELLDTQKTADNEVESTYRVQLHDPLIASDLADYQKRIQQYPKAALQNESHTKAAMPDSLLQNETDTVAIQTTPLLQNESHTIEPLPPSALQNETHSNPNLPSTVANLDPQAGAAVQNETPSVAKLDPYKHLNTLIKAVEDKGKSTFAAATAVYPQLLPTWRLSQADKKGSLTETAVITHTNFCQIVGIQGRRSRRKISDSQLSLNQLVGWYLYTLTQPGILPDARPGYLINRAHENQPPPAIFEQFANLSWELWRCYACLLALPADYQADCPQTPAYAQWQATYGHFQPDALPFGVGEGVTAYIEFIIYGELDSTTHIEQQSKNGRVLSLILPSDQEQRQWHLVLDDLAQQMTNATFNAWLKNAQLLGHDGTHYVIGVHNQYAQEWLDNRLRPIILRTMQSTMHPNVQIRFEVWQPDSDSVQAL